MQNKVGQDEQIERKIGSTQKILYFMFTKKPNVIVYIFWLEVGKKRMGASKK